MTGQTTTNNDEFLTRKNTFNKAVVLLVLCTLLAGSFFVGGCRDQLFVEETRAAYEKARVERVVDGDTLIVEVEGKNQRCRLIGMDCPEAGTTEGDAATRFTEGLVAPGQYVYLERDVSEVDRYERRLRYVWLELPDSGSVEEVGTKMLNGILVKEGHAVVKRYEPDTKYHEVLKELSRS